MAVTSIAHKPGLTKEGAQELFRRHFVGTYMVEPFRGVLVGSKRDFFVVKNAFVGVAVKLEQGQGETKFVYSGMAPKLWARIMIAGLIPYLLAIRSWNVVQNDVKQFIESDPEFH